jgi:hypothetical protein
LELGHGYLLTCGPSSRIHINIVMRLWSEEQPSLLAAGKLGATSFSPDLDISQIGFL